MISVDALRARGARQPHAAATRPRHVWWCPSVIIQRVGAFWNASSLLSDVRARDSAVDDVETSADELSVEKVNCS